MPRPLVSAAVAAGAAAAAAGSGGGRTGGHWVAACPIQEAASWGWTSAERPPLKPDSGERERDEVLILRILCNKNISINIVTWSNLKSEKRFQFWGI